MTRKAATSSLGFGATKELFPKLISYVSYENFVHFYLFSSLLLPLLCCLPSSLSFHHSWCVSPCCLSPSPAPGEDPSISASGTPSIIGVVQHACILKRLQVQVVTTHRFLKFHLNWSKTCRQIMKKNVGRGDKSICGLSRVLPLWRTGWLLCLCINSQPKLSLLETKKPFIS